MAAEDKAIMLCFYFLFRQHKWKTSHGISCNQTWPIGRKWCHLLMPVKISGPFFPKFGAQKHQLLDHFFRDFRTRHRISPERNVASTNKNAIVSIYNQYNVFPTSRPTFRDLWLRNGWDPFAYCDLTFGGHYVATIKVATSLVNNNNVLFSKYANFYDFENGNEFYRVTVSVCLSVCLPVCLSVVMMCKRLKGARCRLR